MRILHLALRRLHRTTLLACVFSTACLAATSQARGSDFAALIERLSEPGGDFAGDNLISNEQSYLRVMPALERAEVNGDKCVKTRRSR